MSGGAQAIPRIYAIAPDAFSRRYDGWLLGAAFILLGLGLVMVASASISTAERQFGVPLLYFWRQSAFVAVGLVGALVALRIDCRAWQKYSPVLLVFGIALLALVLVPGVGREVNGSTRWINLGALNIQPSEPMKLFVALYLAGYLVRRGQDVRNLYSGFFKPIVVLAVIAVLLLLEPDYGATVIVFTTALGMMFLAGVPLLSFIGWMVLIGGALGAIIVTAPYRLARLTTFVDPWADPFGSGFQLTQALIAIGRGEWFGVGLGNSVQKLFYLPEAHTDFLFAVLAEELGLAGVVTVISLFAFIVLRAFSIARRAERKARYFGAFTCYGLGLLIGLQAFVNIGVNLGILPTKGLTLPLMSYGGSSIVVNCIGVALLLRVDHELRTRG